MCSLEGGYASAGAEKESFQRCVSLDAQDNGQALLKAKINLLYAWSMTDYPP